MVKARYTPLQSMVLGVDEQESPHHELLRDADDLAGLPVVVADLHSALPAVLAGLRERGARGARVAYVMTDGGALPARLLPHGAGLRDAGWLAATITVGQAFGGDLEAVNVHTGLLAAAHVVGADVAVVAQGPGNLGTGTRWGFSGTAAGEAVNAAATLGGRPVASLRVSRGRRPRAAPGRVAPQPHGVRPGGARARGRAGAAAAGGVRRARPRPGGPAGRRQRRSAALVRRRRRRPRRRRWPLSPVRLSTMGRGLDAGRGVVPRGGGRRAARGLPGLRPRPPARAGASQAGANGPPPTPDGVGTGRSGRAEVRSAHVDEVDDEDQRLAGLDRAAGATVAVAEVRPGWSACGGRRPSCPTMPWSQPWMTWPTPRRKSSGAPRFHEASNSSPVECATPT